jgi:hypothetical protein
MRTNSPRGPVAKLTAAGATPCRRSVSLLSFQSAMS